MTDSDRIRFAELMVMLSEVFGATVSDAKTEAYFRALIDLDVTAIERAITECVSLCRFFPKPVEIREVVEGSVEDQANQAWDVAVEAYRRAGYWQSVVFEDATIGAAIVTVFGGWVNFSESLYTLSPEMVTAKRKEFLAAYRNARRSGRAQSYLPGHHEIENRNTVSRWRHGHFELEGDCEFYRQQVFVIGARGGRFVEARFDRWTARLITPERDLLTAVPVKYLPPGKPRLMLPEASEEESAPETVQVGAKALARREWPKVGEQMTDEEFEARRERLKEQARQIEQEASR